MFPIRKKDLSIREISNYWAREIRPPATIEELQQLFWEALWKREIDMVLRNGISARMAFLKCIRKYEKNLEFFLEGTAPTTGVVKKPDGSWIVVDNFHRIPIPFQEIDHWTDDNCGAAFEVLATIPFSNFRSVLPGFRKNLITREVFLEWIDRRGYRAPIFWALPNTASDQPAKQSKRGRPTSPKELMRDTVRKLVKEGKIILSTSLKEAHQFVMKECGVKEKSKGWAFTTFCRNVKNLMPR